jgi:biotin transporter BioY
MCDKNHSYGESLREQQQLATTNRIYDSLSEKLLFMTLLALISSLLLGNVWMEWFFRFSWAFSGLFIIFGRVLIVTHIECLQRFEARFNARKPSLRRSRKP